MSNRAEKKEAMVVSLGVARPCEAKRSRVAGQSGKSGRNSISGFILRPL